MVEERHHTFRYEKLSSQNRPNEMLEFKSRSSNNIRHRWGPNMSQEELSCRCYSLMARVC